MNDKARQLAGLYDDLQRECGSYWWENPQEDGSIEISCAECMEDAVRDLIEENGFEIEDEGSFSGSSYDGIYFVIK